VLQGSTDLDALLLERPAVVAERRGVLLEFARPDAIAAQRRDEHLVGLVLVPPRREDIAQADHSRLGILGPLHEELEE